MAVIGCGQFVGNMASSLLVGVNGKGSDSSTTKSAVSDGSIVIRDEGKQTQNVADLSRDVEHANQTLSPIFDKEKEQRRLQEAQKIGEIGSQVSDIARTQGQIEATKAANDKMRDVKPERRQNLLKITLVCQRVVMPSSIQIILLARGSCLKVAR